jgi:hypothetical protein
LGKLIASELAHRICCVFVIGVHSQNRYAKHRW